jgi:hypothetical protein
MRVLAACVVVIVAALSAGPALAEAYGIGCGDPTRTGTITIILTAPNGSYEIFNISINASDTADDKAAIIAAYVNQNSTKFAASSSGGDVGFSMAGAPPQPLVKNCGCITDTAEGPDLLRHNSGPSDGKVAVITLTGTPSSGTAYAGIPGMAVADVDTSVYATSLAVLQALDARLATLGLTAAYVNGSNELVIPITSGSTITWGTTDDDLTSGAEIE